MNTNVPALPPLPRPFLLIPGLRSYRHRNHARFLATAARILWRMRCTVFDAMFQSQSKSSLLPIADLNTD